MEKALLSKSQLGGALSEIGVDIDGMVAVAKTSSRYDLPIDSGKRLVLLRGFLEIVASDNLLFFASDYGVWENQENRYAFDSVRFRRYPGAAVAIYEYPGETLGNDEYTLSLLHLAVNNLWDFGVVDLVSRRFIFFSHDEWLSLGFVPGSSADLKALRKFVKAVCK